jgi:hypothetical protein
MTFQEKRREGEKETSLLPICHDRLVDSWLVCSPYTVQRSRDNQEQK